MNLQFKFGYYITIPTLNIALFIDIVQVEISTPLLTFSLGSAHQF